MTTHRANRGLSTLWRLLAVLLPLALVAAACGTDDDDVTDPGETPETTVTDEDPVYGGSITIGLEAETNTWLPGEVAAASPGTNVLWAIYDSLMRRDADGDVRPFLAESLEVNDDLTVWTVTLRPGVQFHDGTPLDAEALKYNFDVLLKAEGSNQLGNLAGVEMEVVDELTVNYNLEEGNSAFQDRLAGIIGMPFSPTAHQDLGEDAGSRPVGTGPFVFQSWERDSRLVVTRNDNYWIEGLPYLDEIVFRPIPDEDTRLASLLSGDVDAIQTLRQSIVRQARDADGIELFEHIGNNGGGSIFNTRTPPVDDARVRLGLAYALNQDDLVEILGGTGISPVQTQYFSPDSPWYSESVAAAWPDNDPDRARELLQEYIDDPDRSDGKPVGSPIAIEFNCPPDPSLIELSQLYQSFWSAVGIEVSLNQVEQATHIQNAIQNNYMVNCWRMADERDPFITLAEAFGDPDTNVLNFTNFTSPVVVENLEVLRLSVDFDERYTAVENIMMEFTEQVPNLWTGSTATLIAVRPEVKNVNGWRFPDGTLGDGHPNAQAMWGHVWLAQ